MDIEEILNLNEEQMGYRKNVIRSMIERKMYELSSLIETEEKTDLTNENVKNYILCNLILDSDKKESPAGEYNFTLFLIIMFEGCGRSVDNLLKSYDIETIRDSKDEISSFRLIVRE